MPKRACARSSRSAQRPGAVARRHLAVLAEAPIQQTDGLAIHIARAVHLHDHQAVTVALCGADEGVLREVREAGLADQRAGIALQQLVLVDDLAWAIVSGEERRRLADDGGERRIPERCP